MDEWINTCNGILLSFKKEDYSDMCYAVTWMNLEEIMLSEISQLQKVMGFYLNYLE